MCYKFPFLLLVTFRVLSSHNSFFRMLKYIHPECCLAQVRPITISNLCCLKIVEELIF